MELGATTSARLIEVRKRLIDWKLYVTITSSSNILVIVSHLRKNHYCSLLICRLRQEVHSNGCPKKAAIPR